MLSDTEILARAVPYQPGKSGVYFLISKTNKIIYVGQSIDVEARVSARRKQIVFSKWSWVPCSNDELNTLERAYIMTLQPRLNRDPKTLTARGLQRRQAKTRGSSWGRGVRTPDGDFMSVSAASRHFKVSRQAVWERAARGKNGWKFLSAKTMYTP